MFPHPAEKYAAHLYAERLRKINCPSRLQNLIYRKIRSIYTNMVNFGPGICLIFHPGCHRRVWTVPGEKGSRSIYVHSNKLLTSVTM